MTVQTTLTNFERVAELADDYRVAYEQLKHVDKRAEKVMAALENDRELALKRYQIARKAFHELALGEDDEFLGELDEIDLVQPET